MPIVFNSPGDTNLNWRMGGSCDLGVDLVRRRKRIVPAAAVHRENGREANRRHAGDRGEPVLAICCSVWTARERDGTRESGIAIRSVCMCRDRVNPGSTCRSAWNVRIIRPDADQEHQCERDLHHDESTPRAAALPALAERTAAGSKRRAQCKPACLNAGMIPKSKSGGQGKSQRRTSRTVPSIAI